LGALPGWPQSGSTAGVRQEFALLVGNKLEFRISSTRISSSTVVSKQAVRSAALPGFAKRNRSAVREHQRRKHDVRVEHDARRAFHFERRLDFRAQPTASAMSCSEMSSSASLARTESARWMRTGVRMIWPSWSPPGNIHGANSVGHALGQRELVLEVSWQA